jgi:hypothetical protein
MAAITSEVMDMSDQAVLCFGGQPALFAPVDRQRNRSNEADDHGIIPPLVYDRLITRLQQQAPGVSLRMAPFGNDLAETAQISGMAV